MLAPLTLLLHLISKRLPVKPVMTLSHADDDKVAMPVMTLSQAGNDEDVKPVMTKSSCPT